MKIKKRYKKITSATSLLAAIGIVAAVASSCATVDSSNFKEVTASIITDKKNYDDLAVAPNISSKNLIYGTNAFNDGNYVITIATFTDPTQYTFINGGIQGAAGTTNWNGEWSKTVQEYATKYDSTIFPNGIKFLLYQDNALDDPLQWNPYSKYPTPTNQQTATQEEKDNAGKYRRDDDSAKTYRQLVDLILETYTTSVSAWLNSSNQSLQRPESGKEVTQVMVIAFKNNNGIITPNFYNGGSSSDSTDSDNNDTDNNTQQSKTIINQAAITLPNQFSSWLATVYGN